MYLFYILTWHDELVQQKRKDSIENMGPFFLLFKRRGWWQKGRNIYPHQVANLSRNHKSRLQSVNTKPCREELCPEISAIYHLLSAGYEIARKVGKKATPPKISQRYHSTTTIVSCDLVLHDPEIKMLPWARG